MSEEEKSSKKDIGIYSYKFESESQYIGVQYVENYHKRKLETMKGEDVFKALCNAAQKGPHEGELSNLEFVRELLQNKDLIYMTTKDQRKEIFALAAKHDIQRENDSPMFSSQIYTSQIKDPEQ